MLPKTKTITPNERRDWLKQVEQGKRVDEIARETHRDTRTVNSNIDRARRERDFAAAQRNQLRESFNSHQSDLLELLKRISDAAAVPGLDWIYLSLDFGLEDLMDDQEMHRNAKVPFGQGETPGVYVVRGRSGPEQVRFAEEDSKLWGLLQEHVNRREPLWVEVAAYKTELLAAYQARASLNRLVKTRLEEATGLSVFWDSTSGMPSLAARLVSWITSLVIERTLGGRPRNPEGEIRLADGGTLQTQEHQPLAQHLEDPELVKAQLLGVIDELASSPETSAAANSYRLLQAKSAALRSIIEDHQLMRYLPGTCRICKMLGAP